MLEIKNSLIIALLRHQLQPFMLDDSQNELIDEIKTYLD